MPSPAEAALIPSLSTSYDLLICKACGTQYDVVEEVEPGSGEGKGEGKGKDECRVCDDPRQFVPQTGQAFSTLSQMRRDGYKNTFRQDRVDGRIWEVWTEPKFGIGQRAILIRTEHGNVLWDLIAYLDQDTVDQITHLGGLSLILISHPHFYTTWADWSRTFRCPVYLSKVDADTWLNRPVPPDAILRLLTETHTELFPGVTAIICGGHFDGSMVCHWQDGSGRGGVLCLADTVFTVAASQNPNPTPSPRHPDTNSYSFMFSIPNWVPLDPDSILRIWKAIKPYDFHTTYGNVVDTMVVREGKEVDGGTGMGLKERMLQSAKIAVRRMGWREHQMLLEKVG